MPSAGPPVKPPWGSGISLRYGPPMRRMAHALPVVLLLGVACYGASRLLLPEGLVVNAPILNSLLGWGIDPPSREEVGRQLHVAPGFGVELWATVPQARWLLATPRGDLLVSVPRQGRIVRIEADRDGDGRPDGQRDLLTGLDRPHGMDLHEGWLYVAEASSVFRIRFDAERGATSGQREVVVSDLPEGGNHWTRTVRVGPDGGLYVSVGSSCNVCIEKDPRRAALLRYPPEGGAGEIFARGLRNAVGFDWRPATGELYATDNGRDLLGDDFPPCELDLVVQGGDYGWPVANGDRVPDPDFGEGQEARIRASIPPAHSFRPHNAPLGIIFLRGPLPADYEGAALVALHGSWNRTEKDGYEVVSLHWRRDGPIEERPFLWGFLQDDEVNGRPVSVAQGPDGAIFVSDDYAGAVYRIRAAAQESAIPAVVQPGPAPDRLAGLDPADREAAARRGRALFERFDCASCHDPRRAAPGVVPVPLTSLADHYDLPGLVAFLAAPTPPMPVFPLGAEERQDLAVHLLSAH